MSADNSIARAGGEVEQPVDAVGFQMPSALASRYELRVIDGADGEQRLGLFRPQDREHPSIDISNDRIVARSEDPETIAALVTIAKSNGWERIAVDGSPEFRQAVWEAATREGLAVGGYEPGFAEQARAEEARRSAIEREARAIAEPAVPDRGRSAGRQPVEDDPVGRAASEPPHEGDGLAELFIRGDRSRAGANMAGIFLSYVRTDKASVSRLVDSLKAAGCPVWWDDDIPPDAPWETTIEGELARAKAVVVCWSTASIASENVRAEARRAKADGRLIQVFLEPCEPPLFFGERQGINLFEDERPGGAAMQRLIRRLRTTLADGGDQVDSIVVSSAGATHDSRAPVNRRTLLIAGITAVVAAGPAVWLLSRRGDAGGAASVAVMPFANLSGDPAQAYLSDGMAEELRSAIGRLPGIKVIARASSERLRDDDVIDAARKLGVSNILTGSVRRSPSLIRVSTQLVDGASGVERWSQNYDRAPGDVLSIQTGVAQNVARELSVTLGVNDKQIITAGGTENAAAHDLYLKASQFPQIAREAEARQKLALVDAALALDPRYAAAHVLRAGVLTVLGGAYASDAADAQADFEEAGNAARRAISLAPRLSGGYAALALILAVQLRAKDALGQFRKAAALDVDSLFLHNYAKFLADIGRSEEAVAVADKAIALDPLNSDALLMKAEVLVKAGRYDDAIVLARRKLAIAPDRNEGHFVISEALLNLNRLPEARAEAEHLPTDNMYRWLLEALIAAREKNRAASDRALMEIKRRGGDNSNFQYAEIYAQQGETEQAFTSLDRAWAARDSGLLGLPSAQYLAPLRNDPRYKALAIKLDLP